VDKNSVLVSAGILFKEVPGGQRFFVIEDPDSDKWEFVKLLVRKGESSVRAIIRTLGEKGGMTVRVLEEAGRYKTIASSNNKPVSHNNIYYLVLLKSNSKGAAAFGNFLWLDYPKAMRKLSSKKEAAMLKNARDIIKEWLKRRKARRLQKV